MSKKWICPECKQAIGLDARIKELQDMIAFLIAFIPDMKEREKYLAWLAGRREGMKDILERLHSYNPPDRTNDDQRQIAIDIQDAAAEIAKKDAEIAALKEHIKGNHSTLDKVCVDTEKEIATLKAEMETHYRVIAEKNKQIAALQAEIIHRQECYDDAAGESHLEEQDLRKQVATLQARIKELEGALENIKLWCEGSVCEICGKKEMKDTDCYDYVMQALKEKS